MGIWNVLTETVENWPEVPSASHWGLVSLPFLTLVACIVWLRVLWPCPAAAEKHFEPVSMKNAVHEGTTLHEALSTGAYESIESQDANGNSHASTPAPSESLSGSNAGGRIIEAGEVVGDYSADWKGTFDMTMLIVSVVWLGVNIALTQWLKPELFRTPEFWLLQIPKLVLMIVVSVLAGLLCRHFCPADADGYIITSKNSWFKVNYTRKIQHFAAYLVPLLFTPSGECNCKGTLELSWGVWVTLIGFLVMIKPIRERIPLFMLQFNGLDRPEDRPNTLEWIIKYNIWPGEIMIVFFAHLFLPTGQRDLVYIIVFVTGVGDGLAEPVGIFFGKHKYMARSCESNTYYQRSFEGSCCVFIVTIVTVIMVYTSFENFWQFLVALLTLPTALTLAEAFSPHTMDTPFIMGVGGVMLYAIIMLL